MLTRIRLRNFKAFKSFDLPLRDMSVVVGPNNAGKSTAISALRTASGMLNVGLRKNPTQRERISGTDYRVQRFAGSQFGLEEENLRHDFDVDRETLIEVTFAGGGRLRAVWPGEDADRSPYFLLAVGDGQPIDLKRVRELFPTIGTVPVLRPLDQRERVLDDKYVRSNVGGRLASSHFRNQIRLLQQDGELNEFLDYVREWLPEVDLQRPQLGAEIDIYYKEGRTERELVWAGDGMQIFLQILYHTFRLRSAATLVLDEPEVFLHADLQRRLLRLLESEDRQVILATHSSEIIVGAPKRSIVWVDRSRNRAVAAPDDAQLEALSATMGTGFNLRLARVLRTRVALFVEGDDFDILRPLAATLGLDTIATERDVAVVPIEGCSNWTKLSAFDWIAENFLKGAVKGLIIFDRDYWSTESLDIRVSALTSAGVTAHIWQKHEIENYMLVPSCISRVSGAPLKWLESVLEKITSGMRDDIIAGFVGALTQEGKYKKKDPSTLFRAAVATVETFWDDAETRLERVGGKEVLSRLNDELAAAGHKSVTAVGLARRMKPGEVSQELRDVLGQVQIAASAG